MSAKRRTWSVEQKLQLIQEEDLYGITETLRKYNVAQSLFHRWKKEFNQDGITGLQPKYHRIDPEVKQLQSENERLKRIIANQALELEFKNELLNKCR
jgi:transposase-like protein